MSTLVIDNGTSVLKCGLAGETNPTHIFSSCVGRPKKYYNRVMVQDNELKSSTFIGNKVHEHRGIMSIKYPIKHGIVQNWSDMELIWNYCYELLDINSSEHPVLLTEAPLNPLINREKSAEFFF